MIPPPLHFDELPKMSGARMVLALNGWMDGGEVSTGTVGWLIDQLGAKQIAHMDPDPFYLVNFPGSMEVTAMFRPHVDINDGLIDEYQEATNTFFAAPEHNLVLFQGEEPNNAWQLYTDCVFHVAQQVGVESVYFIGSFGGAVPHTREPRLFATVSDAVIKPKLETLGIKFSNYEGPASVATHLLTRASKAGVTMANLSAEIPAYIEGINAKSIEAVARKLGALLDLPLNFDQLRKTSDRWEKRLSKAVSKKEELLEHIQKLEEDYDHEVFDTQMPDLKDFLKKQGVRLD
ncbi:MAG: PAC2 family protein [Phycisphaerales bacterium]